MAMISHLLVRKDSASRRRRFPLKFMFWGLIFLAYAGWFLLFLHFRTLKKEYAACTIKTRKHTIVFRRTFNVCAPDYTHQRLPSSIGSHVNLSSTYPILLPIGSGTPNLAFQQENQKLLIFPSHPSLCWGSRHPPSPPFAGIIFPICEAPIDSSYL